MTLNWRASLVVLVAAIGTLIAAWFGGLVVWSVVDDGGFLDGLIEAVLFAGATVVVGGLLALRWASGAWRAVMVAVAASLACVALGFLASVAATQFGFLGVVGLLVPWIMALYHASRRPATA
ncbi:MAG: hypothetical protein JWL76_1047 [Thermoleophilia bacterium]|nr:hypothetical protein [Thermoleophilia bacterium]